MPGLRTKSWRRDPVLAQRIIEAHRKEPDLSANIIGERFGVSPTQVRTIFRHNGIGPKKRREIVEKVMDLKEFQEMGFLQEINRQFLHPLGLALGITIDDDGKYELGPILDRRDDPAGIIFDEAELQNSQTVNRMLTVQRIRERCARARERKYGYVIQPVKGEHEAEQTIDLIANEAETVDIEDLK